MLLQGKILIVIFGKVKGFCFGWDPLAGIVFELPALVIHCTHALLDTKNLSITIIAISSKRIF